MKIINVCVLVCLSLIYIRCSDQDQILARVGNLEIRQSEYTALLEQRFSKKDNYQDLSLKQKNEILDRMILKKLKLNSAFDQKLNEDPEFVDGVRRYQNSLIQKRYYEKMVVDRIVSASEIEEFLTNQRFEMTASHILISYEDVNQRVQRSKDEALSLAQHISDELVNGADLAKLADSLSDDPTVKHNQGRLGSFGWGQMVEPFQKAVWALNVGEISKPVETRFGYHVIRLDDRKERSGFNLRRDEEALFEIKQKIFTARADSGRALWDRHINELKDDTDFRIHSTALNNLAILFSEQMHEGEISYDRFSPEMRRTALASWNDASFTLDELIIPHKARMASYLVRLKQIHVLKREVEDQAVNKLILTDARKQGLHEDDFVEKYTKVMREERLIQQIDKSEVGDKIQVSDEEAFEYYTKNPSKFEKPAEIELWEIFVTNEQKARDLLKRAKRGADFEQLARTHSEDKQYVGKGGYLGYRGKGTRGPVTQSAFQAGSRKIGGPVKYRNGWTVFKTGRLKESSIRAFESVKSRATSLLRRELMTKKRQEWEQNLRNLYTIEINEELLKRV